MEGLKMDREFIINFCINNAVIIIIVETLFIILFIGWILKKVLTITERLNAFMQVTQQAARKYNTDLESIDNHSYMIKQNNDKILMDMKKIKSILSKYKGDMCNTEINNKIADEIAMHLKNDNDDTCTLMGEQNIKENSIENDEHYSLSKPEDNCPFVYTENSKVNYEDIRSQYEKSKILEDESVKKTVSNKEYYYNDEAECKIKKPFVNKCVDNVNNYLKNFNKNSENSENIEVTCHSMTPITFPKNYKYDDKKLLYNPLYDKVVKWNETKLKKGCV
jgi:hypothetical protein